jgi:hypothetical protein
MLQYYKVYVACASDDATCVFMGEDFATAIRVFADHAHRSYIITKPPRVQLFFGDEATPMMAYDPQGLTTVVPLR